ncbi:hypothetical protein BC829DRAFT_16025 [Chytridium lagenaria]|nr:hypothetical protein BC829DRAFT_16025 [Chytridium lagenaria]
MLSSGWCHNQICHSLNIKQEIMHIPKKLKESNGIEAIKTVSMLGRHLPLEIIAESLSYLDPNDLLSCALVCRQFSAPAIASLWRVIPLADLCDFATYPGSLPSPKSDDHKTVVKPQNHLNNHARLVEIGPGVEQLMVTRFALPLQENVLRQIRMLAHV